MQADATANLGLLFSTDARSAFEATKQVEQALRQLSQEQRKISTESKQRAEEAAKAQRHWAQAVDQVRGAYRKLFSFLQGGFQTMMTWTKRLTVGLAAVAALTIRSGFQFNAAISDAEAVLEQFLGSRKAAKDMVAEVKRFGDVSPFRFPELAQATSFLTAMGVTGQGGPVQWTARAGALAAARGDLSAEGITTVARGIGYLRAGQRGIAMESLRRAGISPEVWQEYGAKFKRTQGGITWLSDTNELMDILARIIDTKFVPMLEKMSQTVTGLYSTFDDMLQSLAADVTRGLFAQVGTLLAKANEELDKLSQSDAWQTFIDSIGAWSAAAGSKALDALAGFFDWLTSGGPQRAWQWATDMVGPSINLLKESAATIDWKKAGEGLRSVLEMLMKIVAWAVEHPKLAIGGYLFNQMGGFALTGAALSAGRGLLTGRRGGLMPTAAGLPPVVPGAVPGGPGGSRSFLPTIVPNIRNLPSAYRGTGGFMGWLMGSRLGRHFGLDRTPVTWQNASRGVDKLDDFAHWASNPNAPRLAPEAIRRVAQPGTRSLLSRALPWLSRTLGPIGLAAMAAEGGSWLSQAAGGWYGGSRYYEGMEQNAPWVHRMMQWMPGGWLASSFARSAYLEKQAAQPLPGFQERWERARAAEQARRDAEAARQARDQASADSLRGRHSQFVAQMHQGTYALNRPTSAWALSSRPTGAQGYQEAVNLQQTFYINDRAEVAQVVADSLAEVGIG